MLRPFSQYLIYLLGCASFLLAAANSPARASDQTGHILAAFWREIPGTQVTDLTSQAAYPNFPLDQVLLDQFEIRPNQEGNFGTIIRGFIHPPQDGNYLFYIASNNQGELWLSSDATPEHVSLIASVPQWSMPRAWKDSASQQSKPISLQTGKSYYIEARHKNGGGDNHLAVAWKLPDGNLEGPIPGKRLSPAPAINVPPPKITFPSLPQTAGTHRLTVEIDYLAQHLTLPLLLTLPANYHPANQYPGIVFLADTDQDPETDGFYLQGPNHAAPGHLAMSGSQAYIGIAPQCPAERNYDQRITIKAFAALVTELCQRYPVDQRHITLTGNSAGGTAAWKLANEMPGFYRRLATINAKEYKDPLLAQHLCGTEVRIYTEIAEGFATDCANRMNEALREIAPKPEVIYLGEKEASPAGAAAYCYQQSAFQDFLLGKDHPQPQVVIRPRFTHLTPKLSFILGFLLLAGLYFYRRHRSKRTIAHGQH